MRVVLACALPADAILSYQFAIVDVLVASIRARAWIGGDWLRLSQAAALIALTSAVSSTARETLPTVCGAWMRKRCGWLIGEPALCRCVPPVEKTSVFALVVVASVSDPVPSLSTTASAPRRTLILFGTGRWRANGVG